MAAPFSKKTAASANFQKFISQPLLGLGQRNFAPVAPGYVAMLAKIPNRGASLVDF